MGVIVNWTFSVQYQEKVKKYIVLSCGQTFFLNQNNGFIKEWFVPTLTANMTVKKWSHSQTSKNEFAGVAHSHFSHRFSLTLSLASVFYSLASLTSLCLPHSIVRKTHSLNCSTVSIIWSLQSLTRHSSAVKLHFAQWSNSPNCSEASQWSNSLNCSAASLT